MEQKPVSAKQSYIILLFCSSTNQWPRRAKAALYTGKEFQTNPENSPGQIAGGKKNILEKTEQRLNGRN